MKSPKDTSSIFIVVGLLCVAFAILFVIATNRAQHVDSLSNILSSIVSGLLGFLGGGAYVAHQVGKTESSTTTGDVINVNPATEDQKV